MDTLFILKCGFAEIMDLSIPTVPTFSPPPLPTDPRSLAFVIPVDLPSHYLRCS